MDEIQKLAVNAALRDMSRKGYVNICTVKEILAITGGIPSRKDMEILQVLHCVHFTDLEPELLRGLPVIMQRVLNAEGLDFQLGAECQKLLTSIENG